MNHEPWDLAIVGAGPAGSICACSALADDRNIRVALIDREEFPRDKSCGDAVASSAASVLQKIGLESVLVGRCRISRVNASFPANFQHLGNLIEFDRETYFVIERKVFDNSLYEAALDFGARAFTGHSLTDAVFDESEQLWHIITKKKSSDEAVFKARVLVGSDGAGSRVRRIAGVKKNCDKHTLVGMRAYAKAEGLESDALRIDYPPHLMPGYGWVFPLQGQNINIGVCLGVQDYRQFSRSLENHLNDYLRFLTDAGLRIHHLELRKTAPLPLASPCVAPVPGKQVALIGDAASMIDPFSGEGIHYAIWAGYTLGYCISRGLREDNIQTELEMFAVKFANEFAELLQKSDKFRLLLRFQRIFFSNSAVVRNQSNA